MTEVRTSHPRIVLLVVLDGWGIGDGGPGDAIARADTPNIDRLTANFPHTRLFTHGRFVGLPSDKDLGGSEVGHLTMGAGRVLDQGSTRIGRAIADGSLFTTPVAERLWRCGRQGGTLHLIGLLSDGNIHSHIDHFIAMIEAADARGVGRLRLHALFDGRDVAVQSAERYVARIERLFHRINRQQGRDYAIASGGGRERVVMDRDRHWPVVEAGWNQIVHGASPHRFRSAQEAIAHFRAANPGLVDQDMEGFVVVDDTGTPLGPVRDGDAVVMMNFRADRALELSEAFVLDDFAGFDRGRRPDCYFAAMTVYDEDRNLPPNQLMPPMRVDHTFGRMLVECGIRQFRLAETQKYPHVTFFFNGGYHEPLDPALETYRLIPSDRGISFADAPEMQAPRVADAAIEMIAGRSYGFGLINFANADMVGHCGRIDAAVAAAQAVDRALGRILQALEQAGGCALITADHGNADEMLTATGEPCTRHSRNPVPCILFDPQRAAGARLRQQGEEGAAPGLANLAATLCAMMGIAPLPQFAPGLIAPA
ncbi:MAG: 2,3-bisphosphoglycerate-independent phosphoglycerate mutase [Zetaproteobacteria bacterium]|nr:MAG: 2,3-bisphosphoglycerate-independent phosphoglycerate mutase [Zetaproteobacteria bacterium]